MNASQPIENIARGSARIARHIGPALWPGEWLEALARWFLLGLAGSIAMTALSLHRWLMWFAVAVGLLAAHQAGRTADAEELDEPDDEHPEDDEDEQPEAWHPDDVIELLWELIGERNGVHLATVRTELEAETRRPWTPADVRSLLADAGVPMRDGVRVRGVGNSTGVHRDDVPPLPSPAPPPAPVGVVGAGHDANTNNSPQVDRNEWGVTITDPTEKHRRHHVPRA
ncbi:hypothetical protein [Streptomyces sp. NBC_00829]|uniref:hypothetical protein n=1 Tax=Streptomyces sp. NBC_00829 TaxID=2903679 RepID=UPI003865C81D|nr:hypothetical protein OG293_23210 [Streptomyces sp. NBC_00829]